MFSNFFGEHQIATFQAPGRYILKRGVDLENIKKPLSESGRYLLFTDDDTGFYLSL